MSNIISIDWPWVIESLTKNERLGLIKDKNAKLSIISCSRKCLRLAKRSARPKHRIVVKRVLNISGGSVKLEGNISFGSEDISRYLKGAQSIYVFAVTIGDDLEKLATESMNNGDFLSGYFLDRIGSYACESLAEVCENKLRLQYEKKGFSVSMRYSPGYCDWPVEEQRTIDKLVDLSKAGIKLNKSFMMIPKKSITAIVGIGPRGLFKKGRAQCALCNKKDCYLRKVT